MKKIIRNRFWVAGILPLLLSACSFSQSASSTTFRFPTPNLTMSKLFEVPTSNLGGRSATPTGTLGGATDSPKPVATISPTAPDCTNLAQLIDENIPDSTDYTPGAAFIKTWTLKNIGTCLWGRGYALVFDHGDQMSGPDTIPFTASVPAGAVYKFSVTLVAPLIEGGFQGFWKLQTPQGVRFGIDPGGTNAFWVKINVTSSPGCTNKDQRPDENGMPVQALFAVIPPVLDGKLADWDDPLPFSVLNISSGETENKAKFGLRWNRLYLYLAVKISDNIFVQETSGAANLLQGDAVEILLDANLGGDFCDAGMNGDDYQLGISPGYLQDPRLQSPSAYLWYPAGKKGVVEVEVFPLPATSPDPKGWILEAKIPWSLFSLAPEGGEAYGFVISVSDNDESGTVHQNGIISTSPRRTTPPNPVLWGTMQIIS